MTKQQLVKTSACVLFYNKCPHCKDGIYTAYSKHERVCNCCFRRIFRHCLSKYRKISFYPSLDDRRQENFLADFILLAKHELSEQNFLIFILYHIQELSWSTIGAKLNMNRDETFRTIYRIEKKLGKVYSLMEPYSLWPLSSYFTKGDWQC